jgi:hypothetical protein
MRRMSVLILAVLAVTMALAGCGGSGPLAVQNVTLSATEGGTATTTFSPSDHVIHAAIELNRIETGLTARVVWTAVDTTGGKDLEIASKDFSSLAANNITAQVELPRDWPTGSYKLDIYLDGKLAKTVDWSVQ